MVSLLRKDTCSDCSRSNLTIGFVIIKVASCIAMYQDMYCIIFCLHTFTCILYIFGPWIGPNHTFVIHKDISFSWKYTLVV